MSSINSIYTLKYKQPEEYKLSHDSVFLSQMVFKSLSERKAQPKSVLDLCAGCGVCGLDFLFHWLKANFPAPQKLDFIEVQPIFENYLSENIKLLKEQFDSSLTADLYFNVFIQNFANRNRSDTLEKEAIVSSSAALETCLNFATTATSSVASSVTPKVTSTATSTVTPSITSKDENSYDLIICNPPYFRMGTGKLSPSDLKNRSRFFVDAKYDDLISFLSSSLSPRGEAYVLLRDLSAHGIDLIEEAKKIISSQNLELSITYMGQIRSTNYYRFSKV